jgi:site-specific DNA-cytosine methylase
MRLMPAVKTYRVGHLFCGIGAGAKGFNDANPRMHGVGARFECAGGVDNDAGAIRNFNRITGARGTVLDLFDRGQYIAVHGHEPPKGWKEATPDDIRRAHGNRPLDVMFISAPCKGFSGLLSAAASGADKYQALNRLTYRGIWLTLEAFKDDPVSIILFENVPRIETRGRELLDEIEQLLAAYGYVFAETKHDCGEIGGLAQSRKRFLLVARHPAKVPPFLYQPVKTKLRGVGEVIGLLPLPGDPRAGEMHRVPRLQWKTWVRLGFVPAGKDWRALNDLKVEGGVLRDYGIIPDREMRDNALGVLGWDETAPTLTSQRSPGQGRFSVADPRPNDMHSGGLGVLDYGDAAGVVAGESMPTNGRFAVADPRVDEAHNDSFGIRGWDETARVVAGASRPANGAHSVADPRPQQVNQGYGQYGVRTWEETAGTVTGQAAPGGGPNSVADPRLPGKPKFNNVFRIVPFDGVSPAVAGPGGAAGGLAVADPRADGGFGGKGKYRITKYDEAAGTVIGGSTTGQGAFALADPRTGSNPNAHRNKLKVVDYESPSPVVTGSDRVGSGALSVADPRPGYGESTHPNVLGVNDWQEAVGTITGNPKPTSGAHAVADPRPGYGDGTHQNILSVAPFDGPAKSVTGASHVAGGALSVADPRPVGLNAAAREGYSTQGHYGVVGYDEPTNAVPGYAKYDRGNWSVADPRDYEPQPLIVLPEPTDRLVARIIALDGTWHRPFTTLELAALQSIFDPGDVFDLDGGSDQMKREWIGNAVPSAAARVMAETIGETLLLADMGETFTLSSRGIWANQLAIALTVDPRQLIYGEEVGGACH